VALRAQVGVELRVAPGRGRRGADRLGERDARTDGWPTRWRADSPRGPPAAVLLAVVQAQAFSRRLMTERGPRNRARFSGARA